MTAQLNLIETEDGRRIVAPTVHLNGTSREQLLEPVREALEAARKLEAALQAAAPNGRDYYTQNAAALSTAVRQHEAYRGAAMMIRKDMAALACYLEEVNR